MDLSKYFNVTAADYRRAAKARLPRFLFDYIDGGAGAETTLANNQDAFSAFHLKQQVMRDVSAIDTSARLCGEEFSMPLIMAPVGMTGLYARRGEAQAARAAEAANIPFTLSTMAICPVEEVRAACTRNFWFQLYMLRDRGVIQSLLARMWSAGCRTLVFTVDLPTAGMRLRDRRSGAERVNGLSSIYKLLQILGHPRWAWNVGIRGKPHQFGNLSEVIPDPDDLTLVKEFVESQFDAAATWKDIAWLRNQWQGHIMIKGIMEVDDARAAIDNGADSLVVSNHGARQLDGIAGSLMKVQAVRDALGPDVEILMDGGVRCGTDVLKAIALGADGVMIGRAWAYALAAGGEKAISALLALFRDEIKTSMMLMGVNRIADIGPDHIERVL